MQFRWFVVLSACVLACGQVANNPGDASATVSRTVTVSIEGNGTGKVTSTPNGIDCGTKCSAEFPEGSSLTLTAVPTAGSQFLGWSTSCAGTDDCVVTVSGDITIRPIFGLKNSVVVSLAGNGAGTVSSAPAGITCPGDCSEAYGPGVTVTLTPAAAAESVFAGWSGGGCSGTDPCVVTTDNAVGVTATFNLKKYSVTVSPASNGSGTVTSTPAGISCGSACTYDFDSGTVVSLAQTADVGSTFTGWGGACSGTGACSVTVTAAATVVANFTLTLHTLTVTKSGNGTGTVTSNPAGISCGTTCSANFNYNTNVVLTPTTTGKNAFAGWSGACTGIGTCAVSMTTARSVTAAFDKTIACSTVFDASGCANGSIPEIVLTGLNATECHDQCVLKMPQAGMTTGCWILSGATCYCRSGALSTSINGAAYGGDCN